MSHRAEELTKGLDAWNRERTALTTFTLRHSAGMSLRLLRKVLASSYSELKAGRVGAELRALLGHKGDVRAAEVTYGHNGWHPHLHALWFADSRVDPHTWHNALAPAWQKIVGKVLGRMYACGVECLHADRLVDDEDGTAENKRAALRRKAVRLFGSFWARPSRTLEQIGEHFLADLPPRSKWSEFLPDLSHGVNVQRLDRKKKAATYLAKMGLELTAIMSKRGKKGSLTPWDLAREAVAGNFWSQRLWTEYQGAMFGSRQLTWSRDARALLGLGEEVADADIPQTLHDPQPTESERFLGQIAGGTWDAMCKSRGQLTLAFLHDAYQAGELERLGVVEGEQTIWRERPPPGKRKRLAWWEDWEAEREAHERGRTLRKCPAPPEVDEKRWGRMSADERHEWLEEVRHRLHDLCG